MDLEEIHPPTTAAGVALGRTSKCLQTIILSVWCGLLAGILEVGIIVLRKATIELNQFYWMSRHFIWLIPATNLMIFLTAGLALGLSVLISPGPRTGWFATRGLCGLTWLALIWAAAPEIYGVAGLILAIGIALRLVPVLSHHPARFRQIVVLTLPVLALLTVGLAASIFVGDRIKVQHAHARPLPPPDQSNVILIVLDTVAAQHSSLHGYARPTSRSIEQLARHGIRFDRVQATASWTLPSHASMFTGCWPHELSAGWLTPLDASQPTLAEYLVSRGYDTAGFIANLFYCGADSGLGRGFLTYQDHSLSGLGAFKLASLVKRPIEGLRAIDDFSRSRANLFFFQNLLFKFDASNRKVASVVNREFLTWMSQRSQPERPFFAFLNYFDAHFPYRLPERGIHRFGVRPRTEREISLIDHWRTLDKRQLSSEEIAFARDSYDDCIAVLDEQIGKLADELRKRGLLERTWLIITADHGESFGEHPNVFGHGTSLYQTQLHVPLVIVPPAQTPSQHVVSETVSLRDLPATIVDLLNLEAGSPFPGQTLARLWNSATPDPSVVSSPALSEVVLTDLLNPDIAQSLADRQIWSSLANDEWTYIRREGNLQEELYDAKNDAAQRHDQAQNPTARSLVERLQSKMENLTNGPLTQRHFKP